MDEPEIPAEVRERVKIIIRRRADDWHASVEGEHLWGCGMTPEDAVGSLIWAHRERFGFEFSYVAQGSV